MKSRFFIAATAIAATAIAAALFALAGLTTPVSAAPSASLHGSAMQASQPETHGDLIRRGQYLARVSDCIACHTAQGGKPFAGGLEMATPMGAIYSSNITPDKQTGIGDYSFADFEKAVRQGVTPSGDTLYPAMPYPSYAHISEQDMQALYAYFMHGVPAISQKNRPVGIPWPLSMRWPLTIWREMYVPDYIPPAMAPAPDNVLARGAYLAEGMGHCGACHTPRSVTMNEEALSDDNTLYLSGGAPIDGWVATNLRSDNRDGLGSWSEEDIISFLRTGRNSRATVFGGMAEVVKDSTQYMNDSDLKALSLYLKSLSPVKADASPVVVDPATVNALRVGDIRRPGAQIYVNRCAACHRSNGSGASLAFPALDGNPVVQTSDPTSMIHIVLTGATLPPTRTAPSTFTMPGFAGQMTDQDVADVVNFIRTSWGNTAPVVSAKDVANVRENPYIKAASLNRTRPTVEGINQ